MSEQYFKILVTQDATMSAVIPVTAEDEDTAAYTATSYEMLNLYGHLFELNDGSGDKSLAYLGDVDSDIEQIDRAQYADLLAKSDPSMSQYTVICLYPDYLSDKGIAEVYIDTVRADSPVVAVNKVQIMAAEANSDAVDDVLDFKAVAIIRGEVQLETLDG